MTLEDLIKYYGTLYAVCKELGIAPQSSTQWKRQGYIPMIHQLRIENLTHGRLKATEIEYKKKKGRPKKVKQCPHCNGIL